MFCCMFYMWLVFWFLVVIRIIGICLVVVLCDSVWVVWKLLRLGIIMFIRIRLGSLVLVVFILVVLLVVVRIL